MIKVNIILIVVLLVEDGAKYNFIFTSSIRTIKVKSQTELREENYCKIAILFGWTPFPTAMMSFWMKWKLEMEIGFPYFKLGHMAL